VNVLNLRKNLKKALLAQLRYSEVGTGGKFKWDAKAGRQAVAAGSTGKKF